MVFLQMTYVQLDKYKLCDVLETHIRASTWHVYVFYWRRLSARPNVENHALVVRVVHLANGHIFQI